MPIITITNCSYAYSDGTAALSSITMSVDKGEITGIAGSNGAGKTTLLNHLCGYTLPQQGEIVINGIPLTKRNLPEIRKQIGVIFQNTDDQLFMPSVLEDVAFGLRSQGFSQQTASARAIEELDRLELSALAKKPPFHLSQGQKRFVAFAGILVLQPSIILMDEPTSDLDPRHRSMLIQLVKTLPAQAQVIVSHDLDFLYDTCTKVIIMNQGKITATGPARQLLADEKLLLDNGLELPLRLQK